MKLHHIPFETRDTQGYDQPIESMKDLQELFDYRRGMPDIRLHGWRKVAMPLTFPVRGGQVERTVSWDRLGLIPIF
jgi:hypothetical protein